MSSTEKKIICIVGPTASGKTSLSIALAKQLETEIVSADSVQIYRGMDIGSAKPDKEERQGIIHHMIDCTDITDKDYTVSSFREDAFRCVDDILNRGKIPIVIGGSGMYMSCFTSPLHFGVPSDPAVRAELENEYDADPDAFVSTLSEVDAVSAEKLHRNDKKRLVRAMEVYRIGGRPLSSYGTDFFNAAEAEPPYQSLRFGLRLEREILYRRINDRVDAMLRAGLLEEARNLYEDIKDRSLPAMQSIGYKQLFDYFDGASTLDEAIELIKRDTRRFAKRQMTWFKRDAGIRWYDADKLSQQEILEDMLNTIEREFQ